MNYCLLLMEVLVARCRVSGGCVHRHAAAFAFIAATVRRWRAQVPTRRVIPDGPVSFTAAFCATLVPSPRYRQKKAHNWRRIMEAPRKVYRRVGRTPRDRQIHHFIRLYLGR
jgi:hypothetical protein